MLFSFSVALQSNSSSDLLNVNCSRSHTIGHRHPPELL